MYTNTSMFQGSQATTEDSFFSEIRKSHAAFGSVPNVTPRRSDPIDSFLKNEVFDREVEEHIKENRRITKDTAAYLFKIPFKTNIEITMDPEDESFISAKRMADQWSAVPMNVDVSSPEKWIIPNVNEETVYFNVRFLITRHFHKEMGASPSSAVVLGNMIMGKLIFGTSYGELDLRITELAQKLHPQVVDRNSHIFQ